MAELLGTVSGEGGPFLIVDRQAAETWNGSLGDYEQVLQLGPGGGRVEVGATAALAWEPEGGATAHLYRLSAESLLLQREWIDAPGTPPVSATAETLGTIEITSGTLVVLWAPVAWEDLWDPPSQENEGELGSPSMLGVGQQVTVAPGRYTCRAEYGDEAYRCWLDRTQVPLAGVAELTDFGDPAARDSQLGVPAALDDWQRLLRYDSGEASGLVVAELFGEGSLCREPEEVGMVDVLTSSPEVELSESSLVLRTEDHFIRFLPDE